MAVNTTQTSPTHASIRYKTLAVFNYVNILSCIQAEI